MMEKLVDLLVTPAVGYSLLFVVVLAMLLHHWRQLALIKTGLIKKQGARTWGVDYEKLRSGLWLAALGGVIAATLYFDTFSGWVAFWLLVALLGVGQVLASFFGRDRWSKARWRRLHRD